MSLVGEDRRTLLKRLSGVSVWGWCFSAAPPELLFGQQPKGLFLAKHQQAVQKGISWLASRVQEDGSFGQSAYQQNLAVVSLGGLAFLSRGHLPNRGPYGKYVSRLVNFVLQHAQQNGLISVPNEGVRGVMYGHGFASLFLAQVYGVTPQREVRSALNNAINLIVSTQNDEGGWRYGPTKKDADISFLLCRQGVGIEAECIPITTHLLRVRLGQRANEEFEFPTVVFGNIFQLFLQRGRIFVSVEAASCSAVFQGQNFPPLCSHQ